MKTACPLSDRLLLILCLSFMWIRLFSCRGVSIEKGLTDSNEEEAYLRKMVINNARKSVLLADYSKIDNISFFNICPLQKINILIKDKPLNQSWKNFYK